MQKVAIYFDVYCKDCGKELSDDTEVKMLTNGGFSIKVPVCDRCMDHWSDGHAEEFEDLQREVDNAKEVCNKLLKEANEIKLNWNKDRE